MPASLQVRMSSLSTETSDAVANGASVVIDDDSYSEAKNYPLAKLAQRVAVPGSVVATGLVGQWSVDTGFFYVCIATNTWRRVALTSW